MRLKLEIHAVMRKLQFVLLNKGFLNQWPDEFLTYFGAFDWVGEKEFLEK